VADAPLVLLVRKDLPAKNLQEFIAYAKANQAKMQHGSGGTGTSSHVGCVLLNQTIGAKIVHVPYRGGGPALQDLIGGRIDFICNYISTALPAVKNGQARVLAVLGGTRASAFPDVPTADEQGLKDFDISAWNALFMPKSTPPEIVARSNAAVSKALDNPALRSGSTTSASFRRCGAARPRLSAHVRGKRNQEMGRTGDRKRIAGELAPRTRSASPLQPSRHAGAAHNVAPAHDLVLDEFPQLLGRAGDPRTHAAVAQFLGHRRVAEDRPHLAIEQRDHLRRRAARRHQHLP
jgi:hypothetical protein